MLNSYFGLIEAVFVFGLAIGFYIWQKRDLERYEEQDRKADRDNQDER
ncbi:hypothetical protein [Rhizobium sp. TRM95796]|nr:hypothetical protein [Rhizobium sp. TRM95796]MCV3768027.1 hypothetical protein [Rhizobium sp. TRM95796]